MCLIYVAVAAQFTEALMHCTLPWTSAPNTRTTLFYKFTPITEQYSHHISRHIDYSRPLAETLPYDDIDARMEAILSAPGDEYVAHMAAVFHRYTEQQQRQRL